MKGVNVFGTKMLYHYVGISSVVINVSQVCITRGHFALDVVALAEERKPVVKNLDVFWLEIFPLWSAFLLLQRRLRESSGCILAGKDCNRWLVRVSLVWCLEEVT
jgi:hypothetical protein